MNLLLPPRPPWRLAGNIPYQISSPLLLKMCGRLQPVDAHVMVQLEFARRAAAAAGGRVYGRLSVMLQAFYQAEIVFTVGPEAFAPPPRVDSALLRLRPRPRRPELAGSREFAEVVRRALRATAQAALPTRSATMPASPASMRKCVPNSLPWMIIWT